MLRASIFCAVLFSLVATPASAATRYVATNGSDAAACSAQEPCKSLQRGYAVAATGDTVEVAAGTYTAQTVPGGTLTLDEVIKAKGGEVGENIGLRRFKRFAAPANGALASYIHLGGKVGVLLEATAGKAETLTSDAFRTLLKDINLHIAASSPICVSRDQVDADLVAKERAIYADSDRLKGKPAGVIEGILTGMIGKFFSQVCLLEQGFVKDPDKTIAQLVDETGKALGDTITVTRFTRFALGEELK